MRQIELFKIKRKGKLLEHLGIVTLFILVFSFKPAHGQTNVLILDFSGIDTTDNICSVYINGKLIVYSELMEIELKNNDLHFKIISVKNEYNFLLTDSALSVDNYCGFLSVELRRHSRRKISLIINTCSSLKRRSFVDIRKRKNGLKRKRGNAPEG